MKRFLTALVLIPLVLLAVFMAPVWLFTGLLSLVAIQCTREFLSIVEAHGFIPMRRLTIGLVALCFLPYILSGSHFFHSFFGEETGNIFVLFLFPAAPLLLMIASMRRVNPKDALPGAACSILGFFYVGFTLWFLILLRNDVFGSLFLLYLFIVVWSGDIFAYYVGRSIGKHKLAPQLSPQKTWEGAIASVLGSVMLGAFFLIELQPIYDKLFLFKLVPPIGFVGWSSPIPRFPVWFAIFCTLVINIAAQCGDLVESAFKRGAGIKDSASILPGHGGLLDRLDALLFAAPAAKILLAIGLFYFGTHVYF